MDEREFARLSDEALARAARWLEEFDPDELDYSAAEGVVTLEFADGTKFVLSRQAATGQIWLAASARGFHFDWNAGARAWVDDKDGAELYGRLAGTIGEKLGREVAFTG